MTSNVAVLIYSLTSSYAPVFSQFLDLLWFLLRPVNSWLNFCSQPSQSIFTIYKQLTFLTSQFSPLYTINLLAAEVFIYCFVVFFFVSFLAFMLPFFISVYLKSKPDSLTNDPQQILMSGFPKDSKGYPKRSCCVYSLLWLRE